MKYTIYEMKMEKKEFSRFPKKNVFVIGVDIIKVDKRSKDIIDYLKSETKDKQHECNYWRGKFLELDNMNIFEFILFKLSIIKSKVKYYFKPFVVVSGTVKHFNCKCSEKPNK